MNTYINIYKYMYITYVHRISSTDFRICEHLSSTANHKQWAIFFACIANVCVLLCRLCGLVLRCYCTMLCCTVLRRAMFACVANALVTNNSGYYFLKFCVLCVTVCWAVCCTTTA